MTRRRWIWTTSGVLAGIIALAAAGLILTLQSSWFYDRVKARIISELENATGGRAELRAFTFDWKHLRATAGGLVLHGKEPADKPPLLRAASIELDLKLISLWKRDVDLESLIVTQPEVYLIVNPDGTTNLPSPKRPSKPSARPLDPLFQLAAGRFELRSGTFEVEARTHSPFDFRGRDLALALLFDRARDQYRGTLAIRPLDMRLPGIEPTPVEIAISTTLAPNRVSIESAVFTTGHSTVRLSGAIEDLASPHGAFHYQVRATAPDVGAVLGTKYLTRGDLQSTGELAWRGGENLTVTGDLHAFALDYLSPGVHLRNSRADGTLSADLSRLVLRSVRFSTNAGGPGPCRGNMWPCAIPIAGQIVEGEVAGGRLELRGLAAGALGGEFRGKATLDGALRFDVEGAVERIDARRAVALYSDVPLPWDGLLAGDARVNGFLRRPSNVRVSFDLALAPAPGSAPVTGQLAATYDQRSDTIAIAHGTLSLPASHLELAGTIGERLTVQAETRDLNELLPAFGASPADVPVKLQNGTADFRGTVSGPLAHPLISGRLTATHAVYSGQTVDRVEADVDASEDTVRVRNGAVARGALRGEFQAQIALAHWKTTDASQIDGSGSLRDAPLKDLLPLVSTRAIPLTGTLAATARVNGTLGDPLATADVTALNGAYRDEPFDRVTGHLRYTGRTVELSAAQLTAEGKSANLAATFEHAPHVLDRGRVRFELTTNAMPIATIHTLADEHPEIKGTLEAQVRGALDLAPGSVRVADLDGSLAGHGLQFTGQVLGDLALTVKSEGRDLRAHIDSAFAQSAIHGDGSWRLEGDYPGSATIAFSRVDFAALRNWWTAAEDLDPLPINGFAEGQLRWDGPLLKPQSGRAELQIPRLEITEAAANPRAALALHNTAPIVASMANSVITVESAHLVGPDTDLSIAGKATTGAKTALDLRVVGHIDLAVVRDIDRDFSASGKISADATVRGSFAQPSINGRVAFENAAFQVNDLPNGISNATGAILFTGDRATIQNFSGETGGGKITLSGFAAYGGGPLVFRLHASADAVRLRYPEGVSTVANANLNFTGTSDRSMLSGNITVLRTGFNPQSDVSSIMAASSEPVRTPSARSGLLGGMNFDIQIQTAPDIQVQSTLTQDIALEANLRLRGTFSNPAVLGRINITQGQVIFFGTKYSINQGSIAFYNPVRVEPVLDIDLETKARGVDVTLTVSGPLGKLNLTPRSDPPLQFSEIVALLATGRAPTSDPTLLAQQAASPQSWQQAGASALLGQAIASPVTGRLQRFFGVSQLRIDPSLPGVEANPQARLTLEQQVTQDITFTYITNVTNSNPQVMRVEWAFAKQWSVVAMREENGMFGIDFYFKKRF